MPSPYPFLEVGRAAMRRALPRLTGREPLFGVGDRQFTEQFGRTAPIEEAALFTSPRSGEPARVFGRRAREEHPFLASQDELARQFLEEHVETAFLARFGKIPNLEILQLDDGEEVVALFERAWVGRAKSLGLIPHSRQDPDAFLFRIPDAPTTMNLPGGRDFPFFHE